jgi:hypothetical protein
VHSEISFNRKEITMESTQVRHHEAWNKGKLVGQKAPFKLKEIWRIRVRLEMQGRMRELAASPCNSFTSTPPTTPAPGA